MEITYQPHQIEQTTQDYWARKNTFSTEEKFDQEKFYCLSMFPYPSGQLHMGHVRNYTIGDVITRYQRMHQKNVLQPIGWDAFGLPAENAAIKHQRPPAEWTYSNIKEMRAQLKRLGFGYDWSREIATCHPKYYRWEQWLFTRLFKKGLVYRKNAMVNWDPVDQTVLANEQVIDGRGWRSNALIERREIPQWFLKITAYADELLAGLDTLAGWPEQVKTMQRNWIGRSEGVEIYFSLKGSDEKISVFTTRPDTLLGVTYLAIAPEHPIATRALTHNPAIQTFINQCKTTGTAEADIATQEKRGIHTGFYAIHPMTGEEIPVWIANFVLMDYGSGAVMSVPAHDQRDYEFAIQYQLPMKVVIRPRDATTTPIENNAFTEKGILVDSMQFSNLTSEEAFQSIADHLVKIKAGTRIVNYRLRDWGISRQRYWGTPIPIIYCEQCGAVPVPDEDLPVILPEQVAFTGTTSPLLSMPTFYETTCPACQRPARRETDTFDTFVESSWYYARFACPNQDNMMLDDRARYWTPVDYYIGGIEHAVLHLLYARFFHKILRDENLLNSDEPFTRLLTQGMVLKDGSKMSKSKGNTVDPQRLIEQYGADTVRLFTIFASPPEQSLEWSDTGVEGAHRFLKRLWHFAVTHEASIQQINEDIKSGLRHTQPHSEQTPETRKIRQQIHLLLRQATQDYERAQFNTVVSAGMKLLNTLSELSEPMPALIYEGMSVLLRLLAPIIPHMTHVLWRELRYGKQILNAGWPKVDNDALKMSHLSLVLQINGKLRGHVEVPAEADSALIEKIVMEQDVLKKLLVGKTCRKVVIVPGRLVNVVAS